MNAFLIAVQVYDTTEMDQEVWTIMEYITGVSLYDYLCRKGRLLEKEERAKFKQVSSN
jgi:serine/threonine protein kinase